MKYQFTLTFQEVTNFYCSNFIKTTNYINFAIIQSYIAVILVNIVYMLLVKPIRPSVILLANIVIVLIRKRLVNPIYNKKIRTMFLSKNVKYLFKPTLMFIHDNSINFENELKNITIPFTSLKKICYIDNYIFLVLQDGKSVLIPIRAFEGIDNKNNFIETLSTSTGLNIEMEFPRDFVYFKRRTFRKRS